MKKTEIKCALKYLVAILLMCVLYILFDVFVCSSYKIITNSMEPTLMIGKRVFVNKTLMGARIQHSYKDHNDELISFGRLKGRRDVHPNDIICFNYPHCDDPFSIEFNDKIIYCKRALGTPGDRIGAVDGHYWNDNYLKPIGVLRQQEVMRWTYDSLFVWISCYDVLAESKQCWNIKNWGPLKVPAKGLTMVIDNNNRELYRQVIEYETGMELDSRINEYTFRDNYYFVVGDNVINSRDSRYWGFIPEDYIIGIVGGGKVYNNPYSKQ